MAFKLGTKAAAASPVAAQRGGLSYGNNMFFGLKAALEITVLFFIGTKIFII